MAVIEVIKYNGGPDVFAWKFPSEELGTWTQLIVNESQEAILFKGGQALDIFAAGRHTLSTANIPLLRHLVNLPFGGRSPFTAEVWYINKIHSLEIKWGTPTPIQLQDPKYNVFIPVRSFGQFGIQIKDSKQFLTKLVGTLPIFDKENINDFFKGLYLTKVKDSISSYLVKKGIGILEINAYLAELSDHIKERVMPTLAEYGITLLNFYIKDISVPEDDTAVIKLKEALSKKAEMDIVGYSYVQERSFDTLEGAATNQGSGQAGLMGAGIGLGMGVGLGSSMGTQVGGIAQNININETMKCSKCNADVPKTGRFCADCGSQTSKSCPKCRISIENDNVKFCHDCGYSFLRRCDECGAVIEGNPKFCSDCGSRTGEKRDDK